MDELIKLLKELKSDVDFENNEHLIDEEVLDSFDIISIVSQIDSEFDIQITAKDVIPENFNSAKALYSLIERLQSE